MSVPRRHILTSGAAGAGLAAITAATGAQPASAATSAAPAAGGAARSTRPPAPVGPLVPDPAGLLALPAGFRYRLVSVAGETELEGGAKSPDRPDGMGAFEVGGAVRLVQNHELYTGATNPVPHVKGTVFDAGVKGSGGCTVIEVDPGGHRKREWVGLSGTLGNCAGGVTPWGTWLTCEENEIRKDTPQGKNGADGTTQQDHGWVFEVAPDRPSRQDPRPIKAFGRFPHEAAVVFPDRRGVYLTEDASKPNGLFYRWTAPAGARLTRGSLPRLNPTAGTLQAMRVTLPGGGLVDDLSRFTSADIGRELQVGWVDVPDRLAVTTSVRKQFDNSTVTRSKKLEGAWGDEHGVYFAASFAEPADVPLGGAPHDGQIWYLHHRRQTLTLKAYFPRIEALHLPADKGGWTLEFQRSLPTDYFDGPDNVHVSPYGGLVIAEDGAGLNGLVGWTQAGGAFRIARNEILFRAPENEPNDPGENSEMAGPTFSPDGRVLFANVQEPGHTYAVTGPWRRVLRG